MKRALVLLSGLLTLAAVSPARATDLPGLEDCVPIPLTVPADDPLPISPGSCPGVRPGALVETPLGFCSFNFLFTASDGYRYIGTAGHCILDGGPQGEDVGERRWSGWTGPWAKDSQGRRIGRFSYAILDDPKDFALIRLYPSVSASPRMCHFGGPTGYFKARSGQHVLHQYGNGIGVGDVVPARTAVTAYTEDPNHVYAYGVVVLGDSGSGVIDERGRAVGVAVTTGLHFGGLWDNGLIGITRLSPQVRRAEARMGLDLSLRTATLVR